MHYKDDWYVIDSEPDDFVLVYYKGSNDAWDGYGGSFLYTRDPGVRPDLIPRLEKAVEKMGLKYKWSDYVQTDNTCQLLKESPSVLREKFAKRLFITQELQLQEQLTATRNAAVNEFEKDEKEFAESVGYLEKGFKEFQAEILKDADNLEKEIEKDLNIKNDEKKITK